MRPTTCPACSIALTSAGNAFLAHAAGDLYCPEDSKVSVSTNSRFKGEKQRHQENYSEVVEGEDRCSLELQYNSVAAGLMNYPD
jgi:hypothetical protein